MFFNKSNGTRDSENCRYKDTLSLLFSSISQLGLLQLLRGDDHLVENFFLVCQIYCLWQITQVAT